MPHGTFTPEMRSVVREIVQDQVVWDLGCGNGDYAKLLVQLGAQHVLAVDKDWNQYHKKDWGYKGKNITVLPFCFDAIEMLFAPQPAVVWLSWPSNQPELPGLVDILARSKTVIYLGNNLDGTACGNLPLFQHFVTRKLRHNIWHPQNTLLVLGGVQPDDGAPRRAPTYEELAGLDPTNMYNSWMLLRFIAV